MRISDINLKSWKFFLTIEGLLIAMSLVLSGLIGFWGYDHFATPLILQDAANVLAAELRQSESLARERNEFIAIKSVAATNSQPSGYQIVGRQGLIVEKALPMGINMAGFLQLDPQGIPLAPGSFILRKRQACLKVLIDQKGLVSIPLN